MDSLRNSATEGISGVAGAGALATIRDRLVQAGVGLAETRRIPDAMIRAGIRHILAERLRDEERRERISEGNAARALLARLRAAPIALHTDKANEQHYELPPEFFGAVLGKRLKYSSCYWPATVSSLDEAEEAMLRLSCRRAQIADGMRILDLGCGWGSLSLWLAEHYPSARIVAVSNSSPQRRFIDSECQRRGIGNVEVITADANDFEARDQFDRILSVEMFEHMRNPEALLSRASRWLTADGRMFIHVFSHRRFAYLYETEGAANWMGRYFFTGGMMPSDPLYLRMQSDLIIEDHWRLPGTHYALTLEAWLRTLDRRREMVLPILGGTYGAAEADRWFGRWRIFFMACGELFAYRGGREWGVSHFLFRRR